jgi:glycine cleavage system aminomethyltransferase T
LHSLRGSKRLAFLESVVPGDLVALKPNQARLTVLTNDKGGRSDHARQQQQRRD